MNDSPAITAVCASPERLTIRWADGATSEVSSLWLRDNRPDDRDPHSGQRLIDVIDLPESPRLHSAVLAPEGIHIEWADEGCRTLFNKEWLAAHARGGGKPPELSVRTWLEGGTLDAGCDFAWASPAALGADPRLRLEWLTRLLQDGLAFLNEVAAEEPALLATMPLIGRVLETNHGLTFDVRSVAQPENLAYTDLGLGLHTDNPYREPVPGFQALHALLPSQEGGESLFADGLALAARRETAPRDFALLTATLVPFRYRSRDTDLYAERPLIQLAAGGEIVAVHYNSRSVAPLPPGADLAGFYAAYRRFAMLLRESRFQLRTRLGAGTLVVFDNRRILHGRTAFASARFPRHLRGCYLTCDSVHSEARLLRRQLAAQEVA